MHQCGLARAGGPQNGEGAASGDGGVHVFQHLVFAVIAEGHVLEADIPVQGRRAGVGLVVLFGGIHDVLDTVDGNPCLAHFGDGAAQRTHGPDQHGIVGNEGNQLAGGHIAPDAHHGAQHDNEHDLDHAHTVTDGPEMAQRTAQFDPQIGHVLVFLVEALFFIQLPAEGANHPHAGQVFLRDGGKPAFAFVALGEALGNMAMEVGGIAHHDGDAGQRHHRQPPVHADHEAQTQHQQHRDPEQLHQLLGNEVADHIHVGGTALDDVAGLVFHMPRKGQTLDVGEQIVAHGAHESLGSLGGQRHVAVAEEGDHQCNGDHRQRDPPQVGAQGFHAAQPKPRRLQKGGHVQRQLSQHVVDGDTDQLRRQHVQKSNAHRTQHSGQIKPLAAPEKVPQQPGFLPSGLCLCLRHGKYSPLVLSNQEATIWVIFEMRSRFGGSSRDGRRAALGCLARLSYKKKSELAIGELRFSK